VDLTGASWNQLGAHVAFTRIKIELTMLNNQIEENPDVL
jgi:hypothetical protein